jgi:hypothetical protein
MHITAGATRKHLALRGQGSHQPASPGSLCFDQRQAVRTKRRPDRGLLLALDNMAMLSLMALFLFEAKPELGSAATFRFNCKRPFLCLDESFARLPAWRLSHIHGNRMPMLVYGLPVSEPHIPCRFDCVLLRLLSWPLCVGTACSGNARCNATSCGAVARTTLHLLAALRLLATLHLSRRHNMCIGSEDSYPALSCARRI